MQQEILKNCLPTDLVCLSLTCHYLRNLALPMIPKKPRLNSYDQTNNPISCECGVVDAKVVYYPFWYDHRRHEFSPDLTFRCPKCQERKKYPPGHRTCPRLSCMHCECITCPLSERLKQWTGKKWKYCDRCVKFTNKKKYHNGRCLHEGPRKLRAPNNHWTHKKGQSYGPRWWRKWGTSNIDRTGYLVANTEEGLTTAGPRNTRVV
ncbi:F-box domain-containing protein [Colletotrichum plurivorum]|uniref:F-box domain-containing protein n=1 Tax=Colletotrichum plurivorum TaxID=2175906 RepID=A0A8H6NHM0_9PEZI|nr:F-box domain-containing protein [Colletotrichum plurivorum]